MRRTRGLDPASRPATAVTAHSEPRRYPSAGGTPRWSRRAARTVKGRGYRRRSLGLNGVLRGRCLGRGGGRTAKKDLPATAKPRATAVGVGPRGRGGPALRVGLRPRFFGGDACRRLQ